MGVASRVYDRELKERMRQEMKAKKKGGGLGNTKVGERAGGMDEKGKQRKGESERFSLVGRLFE